MRYRGLEGQSTTKKETLEPVWNEVFTFRLQPGQEEMSEEDFVEFIIYDRDYGRESVSRDSQVFRKLRIKTESN